MTDAAPGVALRPARAEDQDFFALLYASTRAEELAIVPFSDAEKAAFVAQQFAAQTAHYARHYAAASFDVVLVDGEPAGRLIVFRQDDEILVVDISLLPEHRGRGVGSRLLGPILDEAAAAGVKTTIHVERMNPALSLYLRLDFEAVAEDGVYLTMERPADAGQANTAS